MASGRAALRRGGRWVRRFGASGSGGRAVGDSGGGRGGQAGGVGRGGGQGDEDSGTYIARVLNGLLVGCGLKFSGARWSSADVFTDPPQTRNISSTRTCKSAGENQKPNPKPENPKTADTRPETDPLPSLSLSAREDVLGRLMSQRCKVVLKSRISPLISY